MKLSTLALPSLVVAAGELNITSASSTVTETLTTVATITSCEGGCKKDDVPSTWTSLVTLTTTYCPDDSSVTSLCPSSDEAVKEPTSTLTYTHVETIVKSKEHQADATTKSTSECATTTQSSAAEGTSTLTYTTVETLTTCEGGCDKPDATTQTHVTTKVVTTCPPEDSPIPAPPTSVADETTTNTLTQTIVFTTVKTSKTCEGGCDKPNASTQTHVSTNVVTSCPPDEASTPTEPAEVSDVPVVVPVNGANMASAAFGLFGIALLL